MIGAGTILQNRYRIQKQIGQGGMGAVYIATDERFGSTVAIKETLFSGANFDKAFEREARLLNNLRHPALPRVSDHFSDENGQFIVMEFIAGDDLSAMMEKKDSAFPVSEVLNWADQLLDALDYLHTQEMPVIHRDIKPQNLKLTPRGQIILLDFGLAKGNPTDAQHQTAAKSVFGYSRNYASLEQMQGTGTDPRSDLYALGATLYHLLTGVPPVDALTRAMQVLNGQPDPLNPAHEIYPQIPVVVSEVLQKALALNASFRPTSAVAMRAMLAESETANIEPSQSAIKKPATGLLTQNTEILGNSTQAEKIKQSGVQTEVLPAAVFSEIGAQSVNTGEDSILTKIETPKKNIEIPVESNEAAKIYPVNKTQANDSKRGMAIGATALGGLLLVGSALGGLYYFNPGGIVSNSNTTPQSVANQNAVAESGNMNLSNANESVTTPADNSNTAEPLLIKKDPTEQKTNDKTVAPKNDSQSKQTSKETTSTDTKSDGKVIVTDQEGTKVFDNGKVVTKEGTTIEPDGKITKNGVVLVNPATQNNQPRPLPPNVRPPVITEEQLRNMTPQQRRRLKQILENQRRQGNLPPIPPAKQP